MRKIVLVATLFLGALSCQAQETPRQQSRLGVNAAEKVINIQKTDGTSSRTRLSEMKQISFLALDAGDDGLWVNTLDGETVAVLFESNPVVTVSNGKLVIKSTSSDILRFEITDIAEILFGDASDATAISEQKGFDFVVQDDGLLLRDIPDAVQPRVCTLDGRSIPTPDVRNGILQLNRATLGSGIFIVKVGTFSTKIRIK